MGFQDVQRAIKRQSSINKLADCQLQQETRLEIQLSVEVQPVRAPQNHGDFWKLKFSFASNHRRVRTWF